MAGQVLTISTGINRVPYLRWWSQFHQGRRAMYQVKSLSSTRLEIPREGYMGTQVRKSPLCKARSNILQHPSA